MLKGNLIVGKNQSVVLRAESLRELVRLAETKSRGSSSLRIDLAQCEGPAEKLFGCDDELPQRIVSLEQPAT